MWEAISEKRGVSPIGGCGEGVRVYTCMCMTVLVAMVHSGECWGEDGKKQIGGLWLS